MTLARATDGTVNLHLWREGKEYLAQKGRIFLKEWNNIVFATAPGPPLENTRYVDLSTRPLEFADETFDSVYAYHVFEHLTPPEGNCLAREILRTLKPGGICRVSVPDLEEACQDYLAKLKVAWEDPSEANVVRYQWAVMFIFEQILRDHGGGLMGDMIQRGEFDEAQLHQLFGDADKSMLEWSRQSSSAGVLEQPQPHMIQRLKSLTPRTLLRKISRRARSVLGGSFSRRARPHWELHPRLTKEAVRWMYDRLSLRLLLERAGFSDVQPVNHADSTSRIGHVPTSTARFTAITPLIRPFMSKPVRRRVPSKTNQHLLEHRYCGPRRLDDEIRAHHLYPWWARLSTHLENRAVL